MSSIVEVAWLKMSLPAPTPFLMFVNVNSMLAPDWIVSSCTPETFWSWWL
jgi:hypothetical protein